VDKSTPYYGAFIRALVIGLLSGLSTFLATWSTTGDAKTIGIAAATALLAPFLARFGGEGTYDTNRDAKITAGNVNMKASDVGFSSVQASPGASAAAERARG
jgi:asparagine N-glycosylation enzyme membrane subunit Stt3